jgi:hypothetical protein
MPGAARFGHELDDAAVFFNEVMSGDLRARIAEPFQRLAARIAAPCLVPGKPV